jgi:hypothetical protein
MINKVIYTLVTVIALFATNANGAPMAYSINSDGQNAATWDSLYLIDLSASGSDQRVGPLVSGSLTHTHYDTEGLAFDVDGRLWGVDDGSLTLFPINPGSGAVNPHEIVPLPLTFLSAGSNDFGMTFTCEDQLYLTSVITRTLYRAERSGKIQVVGSTGALGAGISAIAAIGEPTRLFGLGLGNVDTPSLYSINPRTGVATVIGPLVNVENYNEAGLAFDADGNLWAITDRSNLSGEPAGLRNQPSQVLMIDTETGEATPVSTTIETGFESLAIGPPSGCYEPIPTLDVRGLALAFASLMLIGFVVLRRRTI